VNAKLPICLCAIAFLLAVTRPASASATASQSFADAYRTNAATNAPANMVPASMPTETNRTLWASSPGEKQIADDNAKVFQIVALVVGGLAFGVLPFVYWFERKKTAAAPKLKTKGNNGF